MNAIDTYIIINPSSATSPQAIDNYAILFRRFILIDTDLTYVNHLALMLEERHKEVVILRETQELTKVLSINPAASHQLLFIPCY